MLHYEEKRLDKLSDLFGDANRTAELGLYGTPAIYRGHSNSHWKLVPSLLRLRSVASELRRTSEGTSCDDPSDPEARSKAAFSDFFELDVDQVERNLIDQFYHRAHPHLPSFPETTINKIVVAQHYGIPTRLLDWTKNPLIALWFAISNHGLPGEDPADGAVFSFHYSKRMMIRNDADFTNLSGRFVVFEPPAVDARIVAQSSIFSGFFGDIDPKSSLPLERALPSSENTLLTKYVVPVRMKRGLLTELRDMGVDASTIYPGLEGIAAATRYDFRHLEGDVVVKRFLSIKVTGRKFRDQPKIIERIEESGGGIIGQKTPLPESPDDWLLIEFLSREDAAKAMSDLADFGGLEIQDFISSDRFLFR